MIEKSVIFDGKKHRIRVEWGWRKDPRIFIDGEELEQIPGWKAPDSLKGELPEV